MFLLRTGISILAVLAGAVSSSLAQDASSQGPFQTLTRNDDVSCVQCNQSHSPTADQGDQTCTCEPINHSRSEDSIDFDWLSSTKVGYDGGFVIANETPLDLNAGNLPFSMRINGWGQLRYLRFESQVVNPDQNQFQLTRGRLVFSGSAFTNDFAYFLQFDGRSSSGDDVRLLDYYLDFDFGHHRWGLERDTIVFQTGKFKMPFDLARELSGRQFEFSDRSVASTYFDVNRSLGWGLLGNLNRSRVPVKWAVAIFNGLVTGGAETGSSGSIDDNFAYSARLQAYPTGDWGTSQLADFDNHCYPATRVGAGWANSTIDESGTTEFSALRVVDSGSTLASILPAAVDQYTVNLYSVDASMKYRGWSFTSEYYFRQINGFQGAAIPSLFDHGFWLQLGKFVVPQKCQLLARWSRVDGDSGTLGVSNQSSEEIAGGFAWYFRGQNAKLVFDTTYLNGSPISSSSLGISPGDIGWLYRTQIQFAF